MVVVKNGSLWEYKDKVYAVDNIVGLKHPTTGAWVAAVRYHPYYETDVGLGEYVRELTDFLGKFKRHE